jgi:predicted TIM-barrel fold metal-dependent hydrolase
MWSSDYPHSETTWPNSQDAIEKSLADTPEDDRHRLVAGNAQHLCNL